MIDPEMKSPLDLGVGPKSNGWCPHKKRRHRETQRRRPCEDPGRDGVRLPQAAGHPGPPGAGRGEQGCFPRSFTGSAALLTPRLETSSLVNGERINVCGVTPPGSWYFVTAASGNENSLLAPTLPLKCNSCEHRCFVKPRSGSVPARGGSGAGRG